MAEHGPWAYEAAHPDDEIGGEEEKDKEEKGTDKTLAPERDKRREEVGGEGGISEPLDPNPGQDPQQSPLTSPTPPYPYPYPCIGLPLPLPPSPPRLLPPTWT